MYADPEGDSRRHRAIGALVEAEAEKPYAYTPIGEAIGWSNLQLMPNLQMP